MTFDSYAQRLLNPFRGTVHTIRYESAEAVTADGEHWDIYVSNDELLQDLDGARQVQVGDIRYGHWSAAEGLKRGRLSPSEDFRRMEAVGTVLFEYLTHVHRQVPFAFRDHYELWLLDTDTRPHALLHSVVGDNEVDLDLPIEWRAGMAAREHFASAAMDMLPGGVAQAASAADYLARYINACAGKRPGAQWFRRDSDGSGWGLQGINLPAGLEGRRLDESLFPLLMLNDIGHDPAHRRLIDDFHAWQAPWLLLLPHLDNATRRMYEQRARQQVFMVEKQFRLYPEIIDADAIQAARVEAVMRRSQLPLEQGADVQSTFYIELSPSGDE